tara:strand:+ start:1054 stop:2052 length:999 start_codon:yes stop_codon:yes gene_type:complete
MQFSKTAVMYGFIDGLATFLRYIFYLTIAIFTYQRGLTKRSVNAIIYLSCLFCILSACIGFIQGNYIYLNGAYRFMGASASSAGLAIQVSVCLLLIYFKFIILEEKIYLSLSNCLWLITSLFLFYILLITQSRQPILGIFAVMLVHLLFFRKTLFIFVLTALFLYLNTFIELSGISSTRVVTLFNNLVQVSSISELEDIRDASLVSRINYIKVGASHIIENTLLFGAGLNSFPGIYEAATGKDSVAPHNDLLLIFVEFGYFGLLMLFYGLFKYLRIVVTKKLYFPVAIIVFWALGLSLNNFLYYHTVAFMMFFLASISLKSNETLGTKKSNL